ncbi:hypothetical protein LTR37_002876 [Vermiconidia calcicola]|uniref:Uncharacterized protein n=1 Tax=Vermiconidia calcicola TaxID=1690605 RepID=A0ACC3NR38_9PEZI|nr:hypothetical protein LTR37_002876 [Vermiconidia calcicola]
MATLPKCSICNTQDSKYKCPVCEIRYCSIACYKPHKQSHETTKDTVSSQAPVTTKRDRPGTTHRVPKLDFTGFENDKDFLRLLSRYPSLKVQLQMVYGLTLEPGPDEARSWNRGPLPGFAQQHMRGGARGRARGRGQRGGRAGRGGGYESFDPEERQRGPWTQEKGDKEGLGVIKKMRESGDEEDGEGLREFIELCGIKFGGGGGDHA